MKSLYNNNVTGKNLKILSSKKNVGKQFDLITAMIVLIDSITQYLISKSYQNLPSSKLKFSDFLSVC